MPLSENIMKMEKRTHTKKKTKLVDVCVETQNNPALILPAASVWTLHSLPKDYAWFMAGISLFNKKWQITRRYGSAVNADVIVSLWRVYDSLPHLKPEAKFSQQQQEDGNKTAGTLQQRQQTQKKNWISNLMSVSILHLQTVNKFAKCWITSHSFHIICDDGWG